MTTTLTFRKIFRLWIPLEATWLMMAVEGPFIAALIARLAEPKYNLAAYGVAFSFALILEAPVIMIMSAATSLVRNGEAFRRLRIFTYWINGTTTLVMVLFLIPPVFDAISIGLIGLTPKVAGLTHHALLLLLPWPGAIGYRRFYHGLLIRNHKTRRIAYGTIVRLVSMLSVGVLLYSLTRLDGALVGALALSSGVVMEAIATRIMVADCIRRVKDIPVDEQDGELSYRWIFSFYYPLALTSLMGLGVHPMVTFFVGQSHAALESLAVMPVIAGLAFIFRATGLSYQEVAIALMGDNYEGYVALRRFALLLGGLASALLMLIAFTPLSDIWFQRISGLPEDLAHFAHLPTQIISIIPFFAVWLSFQRSLMVTAHKTRFVTVATGLEVAGIIIVLFLLIRFSEMTGATAAMLAFIIGRLISISYFEIIRRMLMGGILGKVARI